MKRKILIVAAVLLGLAVASVGIVYAITNGEPDAGRHPYVGLVVFDPPDLATQRRWRCSGSLLSPTVVLTAGHCTDGAVAARVWFDEVVEGNPDYPWGGPSAVEAAEIHTNPDFCIGCAGGLPGFDYRDVGVVVLSEPVPTAVVDEYAVLPSAGLVDTLKNKTALDVVGYGVQELAHIPGEGPPFWTGLRVRLYAPSQLISGKFVHSDEFIKISLNAAQGKGGTCFGDSGGPDLLGGTDTVLAVNSYVTNYNCAGVGYSSRVDIPEVLEWIEGFLE